MKRVLFLAGRVSLYSLKLYLNIINKLYFLLFMDAMADC